MLGADLLVAPVFTADGTLEFYLPEGAWVHVLDGEQLTGGRWYTRSYGVDSLGLFARAGAPVLDLVAAPAGTAGLCPSGPAAGRPPADGAAITLIAAPPAARHRAITLLGPQLR